MTFQVLMDISGKLNKKNFGVERYHSGPSGYSDSRHSAYRTSKAGGKGYGAALSALALLAFLFLLNIMQQSLQDTNSTTTTTTAMTVILRDQEQATIIEEK
ncbi:uncharacterized protein LOC127279127 [Leptopilina boulardi]|uniref:uncharacterized protein LOC127279127 n=1 Tax=Leptopilina boulardi TaxID=63433 RepID=UPI0021F64837|nr:uncharacterized protein LOC127279127 [Leptopilina boulardi]XP_051157238.1 uncharacterized protein LOC127279127 [Leptopilina boulardi]